MLIQPKSAAWCEMVEPAAVLKIKRVRGSAELPQYMTSGAAGMDLSAALTEPLVLEPRERALVPTGVAIELPQGYEGQVRPRSGLATRHGVTVLNAPGTVDADYRGEVNVVLVNLGKEVVQIEPHMRIAQLVVAPVSRLEILEVQQLSETSRGVGGFGHTGAGGQDKKMMMPLRGDG